MTQLWVFIQRRERLLITSFRQLDSKYDVIESHIRRCVFQGHTSIGVNRHVVGLHSDLRQHGGEHVGFVLAVTKAVVEDLARWMGLKTANTDLNGRVTYIALSKTSEGLNALQRRHGCGSQFLDF